MHRIFIFCVFCVASCFSQQLAELTCSATRSMVDVEMTGATAVINGIFSVRRPGTNGYGCGAPAEDLMQVYEAARWTLSKINAADFVPGIKIGMRAYDDCMSSQVALKAATDAYPQYTIPTTYCDAQTSINLGILGPLTSPSTLPVSAFMGKFMATVISPRAASSALSNKNIYPSFLRTTPSGKAQATAMVKILQHLNWKRAIIAYSDDAYGQSGMEEVLKAAHAGNICITQAISLPVTGTAGDYAAKINSVNKYNTKAAIFFGSNLEAQKLLEGLNGQPSLGDLQWIYSDISPTSTIPATNRYVRGSMVVTKKETIISEFETYFKTLYGTSPAENPWFSDWYKVGYDYRQNVYVDTTVKAVYAYAVGLRDAQRNTCGAGTRGACDALKRMTPSALHEFLKNVDYTFTAADGMTNMIGQKISFDVNGNPPTADYAIFSYNNVSGTYKFQEAGSYRDGTITLDSNKLRFYNNDRTAALTSTPAYPCPATGCSNCFLPTQELDFTYIKGDLALFTLASTHFPGREPLTCDSISDMGAQIHLALKYAQQNIKTKFPNKLRGIDLGMLIANPCYNGLSAEIFAANFFGGRKVYRDATQSIIDPTLVRGVLQTSSAAVTKRVSPVTSKFQLPDLGLPTSNEFSNKDMYPLYTRAHPSDAVVHSVITSTFQRFGWNHIQVVYKTDDYHMRQKQDFRMKATQASICVVAEYTFDESSDGLIEKLRLHQPQASVVVVMGLSADIKKLLGGIRRKGAKGEFLLVGYSWAFDKDAISTYEDEAEGSLIVTHSPNLSPGFNQYLGRFSSNEIQSDSVYSAWYQYLNDCYLEASNPNGYRSPCTLPLSPITSASPNYQPSSFVPFAINSVYAMVDGLHRILAEQCGVNYNGICTKFRSNATGQMLYDKLQNVDILDDANNRYVINNGNVETNFIVTSYRPSNTPLRVADYVTTTGQITNFISSNLRLPSGMVVNSQCTGPCLPCQYLYHHQPFIYAPGDVVIGGMFGISNPGTQGPYQCGDVKIQNGFQFTSAMLYALQKVNNGEAPVSLRGLKVGGLAGDHCGKPTRPAGLLSNIYSGLYDSSWRRNDMLPGLMPEQIAAWMTDTTHSTQMAAELLQPLNIPIISPSATASSLKEIRTFYRTIQGEDASASALLKLSKLLGFNYLQAVVSDNTEGQMSLATLKAAGTQEGICVISSHVAKTGDNFTNIVENLVSSTSHVVAVFLSNQEMIDLLLAKSRNLEARNLIFITTRQYSGIGSAASNMLTVQIRNNELTDYRNYLDTMTSQGYPGNHFFAKYYSELQNCNMPGVHKSGRISCGTNLNLGVRYTQDNYVLSTIDSVYSIVGAMDATLKEICGEDYTSICSNYSNNPNINSIIQQKLNTLSFQDPSGHSFRFVDREGNLPFDVLRYDGTKYNVVGGSRGATIQYDSTLRSNYENIKAACSETCVECIQKGVNFTYIPGDVLFGGVFDVHKRSLLPHICGDINTLHGFQLLEAFHYAINTVNNKEGMFRNILNGVKVGGIGLDGCQSAIRTGFMVSNIHNGQFTLTRNGETVNPQEIDAYIGTYSSDNSIYLSRILNDLKIPQISYAASSSELQDKLRYPYFYRTVPADNKQADAMASFLDKYNIRYVQLLYTNDSYGKLGAKMFEEIASKKRICVGQKVAYREEGVVSEEVSNEVVTLLRQKPLANTVIVFAGSSYINALLRALDRVPGEKFDFKFIGSDTWGYSEDAILGSEKYATGSVTLSLESEDLKPFDDYMSTKTPLNSQGNPWFSEYYQTIWDCYLNIATMKYSRPCPENARNLITSSRYTQDPGVLHVINSVFSSAFALDMTLKEICGEGYTTVCEAYKNREDRRDVLLRKLDDVEFLDLSGTQFEFENREGNKGYTLYSITSQSVTSGYYYKKIGKYSSDGNLDMQAYSPDWNGSCDRDDACSECPTVRNRGQRFAVSGAEGVNPTTMVAVFDIHHSGLDEFRCGDLDIEMGFQQYLAFTYTLNQVVQGVDIRSFVLDTCSNNLRVEQDIYNLLAYGELCNSNNVDGKVLANSVGGFVVSNNDNTEAAARVLNPLSFTYLSPSATSVAFNDMNSYSYLARTVPPQNELLKVIHALLKEREWDLVSPLVSFDPDMNAAYNTFKMMANENNICTGSPSMLTTPLTRPLAENALRNQFDNSPSRVIILFTTWEDTKTILQAAQNLGYLDQYLWILTDNWAMNIEDLNLPPGMNFEAVAISIRTSIVNSFRNYMNSLTYDRTKTSRNTLDIPREWFEEFFQRTHRCRLDDAVIPRIEFSNMCTKNETLNFMNIKMDQYILNTIAAAYANAEGVKQFMSLYCTPGETLASCVARQSENMNVRQAIRDQVLLVQWNMDKSVSLNKTDEEFNVNFNSQQFWHPGYDVTKIRVDTTANRFDKNMIGKWTEDKFESTSQFSNLRSRTAKCLNEDKTECGCPLKAEPVGNGTTGGQTGGMNGITEPRNWYYYNDGAKLYEWPIWAIVVAVLTCVGLLVSIITLVYLLIAYPVRGGTTILGYISLIGIILIYILNFAFFFHASLETCTTRRLAMGIVYAIVFGPLLVKAVDNWFRKHEDFEVSQYRGLTSTCALVLMALFIILIQVIIPIEWLILVWPTASKFFPSDVHDYWWCDPMDQYDVGLVLSLIYVMFLVILTGIFAGMAWDSWRNNYESRWIFIGAVCTAGCMFVWMIVTTNAGPTVRDAAVTIGNFVNATALLLCIPLRKMIILCNYKEDKEENGGELYDNIYANPSFDPDFPDPGPYPKSDSKQGSEVGF
ncbi:hypothetical protein SNE40_002421 [Patella caerulea]|uniref:G-protein coupled receptors family 3 profile domain-containing protein n=1 Tax=Patella caerulea TaxID=87958 RepID=A0AAN8KC59_PATCE